LHTYTSFLYARTFKAFHPWRPSRFSQLFSLDFVIYLFHF
jgi:hypothetical protein